MIEPRAKTWDGQLNTIFPKRQRICWYPRKCRKLNRANETVRQNSRAILDHRSVKDTFPNQGNETFFYFVCS